MPGSAERSPSRGHASATLPAEVRAAYDALPYLVWAAAADGTVLFYNRAMRAYLAAEDRDAADESWIAAVHEEDRPLARAAWEEAVGEASAYRCELRLRERGDGPWRWHVAEARPVRDDDGAIVRWVGSLVDVQDRHDAERRLRESARRLRSALDKAPLPMILFTEDGDFLLVNEAFLERSGYTREELPDIDAWMRLAAAHAAEDELLAVRRPFDVQRRMDEGEFVIRTRSGEERIWNFFTAAVGYGADGRRLLVTMADDVTERKRAARRLHVLAGTLEQRVTARTRELARRTAQLRELACELGLAEERERQRLAEVLHDHVQQLLVAAKMQVSVARRGSESGSSGAPLLSSAERLIDDTLATIRSLTAQLRPLVLREEGLAAALAWLADQMHARYELDVATELATDAEPADENHRRLLYEAARELLFNVVKHAGVHEAKVALERCDGRVRLTVADAGDGFDPQERRRPGDGNGGFGLEDLRDRLAFLGGELRIESRPSEGTRIEITLPPS